MASFYLQIKLAHIGLVLASGALFAVRGLLVQTGQHWALAKPVRRLSIGIDTLLLVTALLLLLILHLNPFTTAWIAVKLVLLVVYIALGVFAFAGVSGRTGRVRFHVQRGARAPSAGPVSISDQLNSGQ